MELKSIKDAFDRVAKKQKLSYNKTNEIIHMMSQEIEKALSLIQETTPASTPLDHRSILSDVKKTFLGIAPTNQLETTEKELNVALTKYPKVLEKQLNTEIAKAYRHCELDTHSVNQIIANFFYRQGMFDIGDCFIAETGEPECSTRQSFIEMYQIIEAMKRRDLEPALTWTLSNSDKLKEAKSDLEMKLHSLHFLEIAQGKDSKEAINYARIHLTPYADSSLADIQKLMCSLLWNRKLDKSPYSEFLSPTLWNNAIDELTKQYCRLLGESTCDRLSLTMEAGIETLPVLLKYINVVGKKKEDWQTVEQLPCAVDLPDEFKFHSTFVCPVTREHSNDENPPMMMTCGHVLCKQTINRMSKNGSKSMKCPYCPAEVDISKLRQLHF